MEEITWIIYRLLMATVRELVGEMRRLLKEVNRRRLIFSILICFIFVMTGWWIQKYLKIEINDGKIEQIATIIASSLISLVAFIGMMLIFGFENIDRKRERLASRGMLDEKQRINLDEGEKLGRELMFKFSIYTFTIVILNLFLLIFSFLIPENFKLAIFFSNVALTGYSFYLITRIVNKIF